MLCQEVNNNMHFFYNGGYNRNPYLNSAIPLMPIMSAQQTINMDQMKTLRVEKQIYGLFLPLMWPLANFLFGGL